MVNFGIIPKLQWNDENKKAISREIAFLCVYENQFIQRLAKNYITFLDKFSHYDLYKSDVGD
jgi:hypothetical protein